MKHVQDKLSYCEYAQKHASEAFPQGINYDGCYLILI